ncbi:TPA: hypothetical protein KML81_004038 [Escherichia coli]|uniref:Uncharacterized protein n=1 Tax=Escherichia marmotae TaxID=1499973 RepID=A0A370V3S7_9ESCH|nr:MULTISPECIES: hypothetical protein [Escherichia]EEJ2303189.1 hypothetical protein [Salmonella enterica subsp. enterica]EFG8739524.1 hypothetical protein [Escherichia coli]EFM6597336.1 hypothetical protein [Escherichia coli]EJH1483538.1 hypothetical protein [Escherichia coli]EKP4642234.1 hypothetical protein [Escherichia coli]
MEKITVAELIQIFLLFAIVIGCIIFMLHDIDLTNKRNRFEKALKESIRQNKLKNEDVHLLASRWSVKPGRVKSILLFILSDFLTSNDCPDHHIARIRELIEWHDTNDPFAELPENIKLQLQHILRLSATCQPEVTSLTRSLHDIYTSNQKKMRRAKIVSFIISVASLLTGIYSIFFN